jgi:predicted dehydrogenase
MTNKVVKWGILGTSPISETMVNAIKESSNSIPYAIASRSMQKAQEFASQHQVPHAFGDYHELINHPEIDVVYIGLPNHLHKEWIILAARAGKHILCEKPMFLSRQDCDEVLQVIKDTPVLLMEGLMYLHHPLTAKLNEIIDSGLLGDVKQYVAYYAANIAHLANKTSGGCIRNLGCYPMSLIRLLAKSEPITYFGLGRVVNSIHHDHQATLLLEFPEQVMASISSADDLPMQAQFDIYGTKGKLKMLSNPWLPNQDQNKILITLDNEVEPIEIDFQAPQSLYTYQINALSNAVLHQIEREMIKNMMAHSIGNAIALEQWRHVIMGHSSNH